MVRALRLLRIAGSILMNYAVSALGLLYRIRLNGGAVRMKDQAPSLSSVIPLIKRESTRLAQGEGQFTMALLFTRIRY